MWHTADKHVPAEMLRVRGQNSLEDWNTQAAVSTTELKKKKNYTSRSVSQRSGAIHDWMRCGALTLLLATQMILA